MGRKLLGVLVTVALATGAMVALVGPASAGVVGPIPTLTITVHKEITGTPDSDQAFAMQVACSHDGEVVTVDPDNTQAITWNSADETFTPSADAVFTIDTRVGGDSEVDITCTVTETDAADAGSSTIECVSDTPPAVCDDSTAAVVTIPYALMGDADLTVTNDYPPPVPLDAVAPAPVVAPATFTG